MVAAIAARLYGYWRQVHCLAIEIATGRVTNPCENDPPHFPSAGPEIDNGRRSGAFIESVGHYYDERLE
jgi:hypothetical protein